MWPPCSEDRHPPRAATQGRLTTPQSSFSPLPVREGGRGRERGQGGGFGYDDPAMAEDTDKPNDILELAPETRLPEDEEEKTGFFGKLKRGLFMTHTEIIEKVSDAMKDKVTLDDRTIEYLEE